MESALLSLSLLRLSLRLSLGSLLESVSPLRPQRWLPLSYEINAMGF